MTDYIQIYWTCENEEAARRMAGLLLEKRLVACANIIPHVESLFTWQGKIDACRESKVIFKTRKEKFEEIKEVILKNATYQVPEILAVPILAGHADYLKWIDECLS